MSGEPGSSETPINDRINEAALKARLKDGGDVGLVTRISQKTGIPLNPKSGADVKTAQSIDKASQSSTS